MVRSDEFGCGFGWFDEWKPASLLEVERVSEESVVEVVVCDVVDVEVVEVVVVCDVVDVVEVVAVVVIVVIVAAVTRAIVVHEGFSCQVLEV